MKMTPLDLENQKFHEGFRGYKREEVDSFLEKLVEDYTSLFNDNRELREKVPRLEAQLEEYHRLKESVERSVMLAQKTADEAVRQAEERAGTILAEAKLKAEQVLSENRLQLEQMKRELRELESRKSEFAMEFRLLLETHMRLLENNVGSPRKFVQAG